MGEKERREKEETEEKDDPWKLVDLETTGTPFSEKSFVQKVTSIGRVTVKLVAILGFLYIFVCSLDFLSSAFRLLGGKRAGETFRENDILNNPIAAMTIGVLATVLLQSSSTTTSIVVAMVGSEILKIKPAIFMVMGANIGTSVTNTIVALGQSLDRNEFRKAFAGATVHDMFNWLSVIVILPIEWVTGSIDGWNNCGMLCQLTKEIVKDIDDPEDDPPDFLKELTEPLTKKVIEVNKNVIEYIAKDEMESDWDNATLVKTHGCNDETEKVYSVCEEMLPTNCTLYPLPVADNMTVSDMTTMATMDDSMRTNYISMCSDDVPFSEYVGDYRFVPSPCSGEGNASSICYEVFRVNHWLCHETRDKKCSHWFMDVHDDGWSDAAIGVCVLILALGLLIICLVSIVKLLHSLLKGHIARLIRKFLNSNLPGRFGRFITGYIAIAIGAGLTMLVQSSSIFTSAVTPLVGVGVLHIKRMYPLTLGANIGTTVTAILAALASDPDELKNTMQIAMCHLFFNIIGILIWYPIPFMRKVPIKLAKILGNTTAKYRWFAVFYLIIMFLVFPAIVLGLSIAGWYVILAVGGPLFILFIIVIVINVLQRKIPHKMGRLANWDFLPLWMHSLAPLDRLMTRWCVSCLHDNDDQAEIIEMSIEDDDKLDAATGVDHKLENETKTKHASHSNGNAHYSHETHDDAPNYKDVAYTNESYVHRL